jgi:hypothetical protein
VAIGSSVRPVKRLIAGFGSIHRQPGAVHTQQDQLGNLRRKADMRHPHRAHQVFQRVQERHHEIQLAHGGVALQRVQRAEQRMHLRAIVGSAQQQIDGTFDLLVGVAECLQIIRQRIRIAQAGFVEFESTDHEPSQEENRPAFSVVQSCRGYKASAIKISRYRSI